MSDFDDLRLRQLDSALGVATALRSRPPPPGGWIRTVREALGMSLRQLAKRTGLSKTAVASIEKNEAKGSVRLESLVRLADAMDCEFVYAVVPRRSLEETLKRQTTLAAEHLVRRVSDSMELEAQGTSQEERDRLVEELEKRLRDNPADVWDV